MVVYVDELLIKSCIFVISLLFICKLCYALFQSNLSFNALFNP